MIVVKAKRPHYAGRTIGLPGLGQQSISKEGTLEIEDDLKAHTLVKCLPDFTYVDPKKDDPDFVEVEPLKEKSKSDEINTGSDDPDESQINGQQSIVNDLDDEEKKELIEQLPTLTKKDLDSLAKAYPGGEWRGKNKEQLVTYLADKLKSTE